MKTQMLSRIVLLFVLVFSITIHVDALPGKSSDEEDAKVSSIGKYEGYSEAEYKGFKYYSQYVTMRDSVQLAVDYFLPKRLEEGKQLPTIIYLTRYVRSLKAKFPFNLLKNPVLVVVPEDEIKFFIAHGYACVIVDVRGSGASLGQRTMEFSPEEVRDGYDIVEWIIHQPWSNGKVASTGVSYVGTTAELLLANEHPAVKACIPRSNIFDLYNHVIFPGGVRQGPFIKVWGFTTKSLDGNNLAVFGKRAKRLIKGINPVKGDKKKKKFKQALENHKNNFDVYEGIFHVNYRDEDHPGTNLCPNDYSIHSNRSAIESSGTPIYRIGGWYDGALCKSVIEGYWNTSNTEKVLIGPWDHGPHDNASPYADSKDRNFSVLNEMLRFFDYHLKGIDNGIEDEDPIYYYTVGEEKWKSTDTWPLKNHVNVDYFFSGENKLVTGESKVQPGEVVYEVDDSTTTGPTTRWNSQTALYKNGPTDYPERSALSATLLNFTASPFKEDVEMTGHPIIDLYFSADATDATIFCYIEDVAPDSTVTYVTEGLFRALHRKVSENKDGYVEAGPFHSFKKKDAQPLVPGKTARVTFDLLPISYLFKKGHSMRISIAGADIDHFDLPDDQPDHLTISYSDVNPSKITIPVVDGSASQNTGLLTD